MPRWSLLVVVALATAGCNRGGGEGEVAREDGPFEERWAAATEQLAPIDVRADDSTLAGNATKAGALVRDAVPAGGAAEPLSHDEVTRFVRTKMGGIQTCYHRAARGRPGLTGRALLNFTVTPSGDVSDVAVDAPRFGGTGLDRCVESRVKGWQFRRFAGDPLTASYPLVFVGR